MSDEPDYTPIASLHVSGTKEEWLAALKAEKEQANELAAESYRLEEDNTRLRELNAVMLEALRIARPWMPIRRAADDCTLVDDAIARATDHPLTNAQEEKKT